MNHVHQSLTNHYIQDYIQMTHELYPSFITRLDATYFSLNVTASNWDPNFNDFYKTITNDDHGGRYSVIFNVPILLPTNNTIAENATEKGITVSESTSINCLIDPFVNIIPKDGDILLFRMGLNSDILYRIVTLEMSSTLVKPYYRLSLQAIPNLSKERMFKFVIEYNGFIPQYHLIFEKESALNIIKLQNIIKDYIDYFNSIYDSQQDVHVDNDNNAFLEFEKAFRDLITQNEVHLGMMRVDKSYLCDNLLSYYSDDNPFKRMLTNNIGTFKGYQYTANIKRLEKTRRRSLNNRIKIYRLITSDKDKNNDLIVKHDLSLPLEAIQDWDKITNNKDFNNNVKNQLSYFIENQCKVNPTNMFINAIRLSQVFSILTNITKSKLENRVSNINRQLNSI